MPQTSAYGAPASDQPLASLAIERREPGPKDVSIDILYCGVCHSDLHFVRGEWGQQKWPIVPGHEIVGRVTAVGGEVEGFRVGDLAGVGCMVDSCRTCSACAEDLEQFCENGNTLTYGSEEKQTGGVTQGGYSKEIVVDQDFCLHVSEDVDLAATAPLLCAGITTYSPLRHWNVGPDSKVGVVGLGGLGHMAVKIAKAMGAEVTVFTTSPEKTDVARELGADHVVISKDADQMASRRGHPRPDHRLDRRLPRPRPLPRRPRPQRRPGPARRAAAAPPLPRRLQLHPRPPLPLRLADRRHRRDPGDARLLRRARGHRRRRDDLDGRSIDEAYDRMERSDVKFRFVIDMETMPAAV